MIKNPILPGFYPDPSICRVEDDYYLVTSSFSYFPGVPIFHSRDLVHWEQLGHVLDRPEQVHLTYEDISTGIFAPTIRYHQGVFYMITTNITTRENFVCTAVNPAGPWSEPYVIQAAGGIDPSLFFDDDGRCYFTGTAPMGDSRYDHQVIVMGEMNLETFQIVGELQILGDGALKDAIAPEGPHIYKKDGWYYLLIAEGGTEHFHAVTVSRSRQVNGPYENYQGNPILTHRHLGKYYPICNVGHADMVELPDGSWYMVCLGSRLADGYHKLLGRETFLVPVDWEDDWPVVSPGSGKVEWEYESPPLLEWIPEEADREMNQEVNPFGRGVLGLEWNVLGTPYESFYRLEQNALWIRMKSKNLVPWEYNHTVFDFMTHLKSVGKTKESMPFVGRRLTGLAFEAEVQAAVSLHEKESAGLVLLQNNFNQLRLECSEERNGKMLVRVIRVVYCLKKGIRWFDETELGSIWLKKAPGYRLVIQGNGTRFTFLAATEGNEPVICCRDVDGSFLGSETAGGFVGTYVGMYASGNGTDSANEAQFSNFFLRRQE